MVTALCSQLQVKARPAAGHIEMVTLLELPMVRVTEVFQTDEDIKTQQS